MATLEKIRKRSVLLLVIIGAALVAFIIGDFLNSGRNIFGDGTTVAKVDGEKSTIWRSSNATANLLNKTKTLLSRTLLRCRTKCSER